MGTCTRILLALLALFPQHAALAYRHPPGHTDSRRKDVQTAKDLGVSRLKREHLVLCYGWRPNGLTLNPGKDSNLTVQWEPAFNASGFILGLSPQSEQPHKSYYAKYTSFESRLGITEHTFSNLSAGRYKAWFQPTGCTDCPATHLRDCVPDPIESQEVTLPAYEQKAAQVLTERRGETQPGSDLTLLTLLGSVPLVFLFTSIILLLFFVRRARRKTADGYFEACQDSNMDQKSRGGTRFTCIVLLYTMDHTFHVAAVRSLAALLRVLLHVQVLELELDTGGRAYLPTGDKTVVLVVLSPGMLQMGSVYQEAGFRQSADIEQVYSQVKRCVHSLIHKKDFQINQVIPVSLGYTHCTCVKLQDSFTYIFPERSNDLTCIQDGFRACMFSKLWKSLQVHKPISAIEDLPEARMFLRNVDKMEQIIEVCGQWCQGQDEDLTNAIGLSAEQRVDSTLETATVGTNLTGSRHESMNLFCWQSEASQTVQVSCGRSTCVKSQRGLEDNLFDASCVTLDTLGLNRCGEIPISEKGILLAPPNTSIITLNNSTQDCNSSHSTLSGGRDC